MNDFSIITCGNCAARIRIPAKKNIHVTCPRCGNMFDVYGAEDAVKEKKKDPLAFLDIPMHEADVNQSAPYVLVLGFQGKDGPYREFSTEWRCDQDALNTYFNVHCWYTSSNQQFQGIGCGSGYTGFQNVNGGHMLIFSMWETKGMVPSVEYYKEGSRAERFYGEGTGMKVCIPCDWKVGIWYTLRVKAETRGQKTYYSLYLSPNGGAEEFMAAISFPMPNLGMPFNQSFLEDFTYNGLERAHSLRNIRAVTMNGRKAEAKKLYVYEYDSKLFRKQNQSLKCTCKKSLSGVFSVRSSGKNLVKKSMFPTWI